MSGLSRPNWAMPVGSRDRWPEDYELGRPGYPRAAVDVAGLAADAMVLDLVQAPAS